MVSFKGQKKLGPRPDRSSLEVYFKISDEHPHPFHMRSPPHGGLGEHSTRARVQSVFLITYVMSGLAEQPKKWEE